MKDLAIIVLSLVITLGVMAILLLAIVGGIFLFNVERSDNVAVRVADCYNVQPNDMGYMCEIQINNDDKRVIVNKEQ